MIAIELACRDRRRRPPRGLHFHRGVREGDPGRKMERAELRDEARVVLVHIVGSILVDLRLEQHLGIGVRLRASRLGRVEQRVLPDLVGLIQIVEGKRRATRQGDGAAELIARGRGDIFGSGAPGLRRDRRRRRPRRGTRRIAGEQLGPVLIGLPDQRPIAGAAARSREAAARHAAAPGRIGRHRRDEL